MLIPFRYSASILEVSRFHDPQRCPIVYYNIFITHNAVSVAGRENAGHEFLTITVDFYTMIFSRVVAEYFKGISTLPK